MPPEAADRSRLQPALPAGANAMMRRWLTVALFCFLYAASFVDRMILGVLVDPIKADLHVSDSALGLLFGTGFALFYACGGLPLAHLADRGNRRRVLLVGVVLWSLATLAAGFSDGFVMLLVTRAGVAIGEAVLMPVAVSMIADLFPRDRRALPTSIFSTVGAVMGSASLIVGGGALLLAIAMVDVTGLAPWRMTFVLVALPGLIGALLFALLVREPVRQPGGEPGDNDDASVAAVVRHLRAHAGLYLGMFLGTATMLIQAMGMVAWGATILVRAHGLSNPAAGAAFGAAAVTGSVIGTLSVPLILRRLVTVSRARAIVLAAMAYALVTAPFLAIGIGANQLAIILSAIAIGMGGLAAGAVLPPLLVQAVTPHRLRARVVAVYLLLNNFLSLGIGPLAVAMLAQRNPAGGLSGAMSLMGWLTLAIALSCYGIALRAIRGTIFPPAHAEAT